MLRRRALTAGGEGFGALCHFDLAPSGIAEELVEPMEAFVERPLLPD